jgi:hypothetical protein
MHVTAPIVERRVRTLRISLPKTDLPVQPLIQSVVSDCKYRHIDFDGLGLLINSETCCN